MGVTRAVEPQRRRISGANDTFPGQRSSGRFRLMERLLGKAPQIGPDWSSTRGVSPVVRSLPLKDRAPGAQVFSSVEPRWGHALNPHWDGLVPLAFMGPNTIDPHTHGGYSPFRQYPTISRGHPIPYGDTVPVLGSS